MSRRGRRRPELGAAETLREELVGELEGPIDGLTQNLKEMQHCSNAGLLESNDVGPELGLLETLGNVDGETLKRHCSN
jgi:hypothetical protein